MSEMVKRTVRLYKSDLVLAKRFYPHVGYNHVLRLLLHRHLIRLENAIREREGQLGSALEGTERLIENEILVIKENSDGA